MYIKNINLSHYVLKIACSKINQHLCKIVILYTKDCDAYVKIIVIRVSCSTVAKNKGFGTYPLVNCDVKSVGVILWSLGANLLDGGTYAFNPSILRVCGRDIFETMLSLARIKGLIIFRLSKYIHTHTSTTLNKHPPII